MRRRIFFADSVAGFSLLIFQNCGEKVPRKNPPGKSPAKSSKIYTTKIPDTFLQRSWAKIYPSPSAARDWEIRASASTVAALFSKVGIISATSRQGEICLKTSEKNQRATTLDGRNRAIVIAESLATVIAAIRIASVRWSSYLPRKHRIWSSQALRSLRCDSNRAIGVHWCSIRSTWNCGMACES